MEKVEGQTLSKVADLNPAKMATFSKKVLVWFWMHCKYSVSIISLRLDEKHVSFDMSKLFLSTSIFNVPCFLEVCIVRIIKGVTKFIVYPLLGQYQKLTDNEIDSSNSFVLRPLQNPANDAK